MPRRTQIYQQLPWIGGINTSVEAGVLPPQDLTICDNVQLLSSGIKTKREGFSYFNESTTAAPIIHIKDYWRFTGSAQAQQIVAVTSTPAVYTYTSGGTRSTASAQASTFTVTIASPAVFTVASTANYFVGMPLRFTTTGALPTGLSTSTTYYVSEVTSGTDFKITATLNGTTNITTTGTQSGTHSLSSVTTFATSAARANSVSMNEKLILFFDGANNKPRVWNGTIMYDLVSNAPDASFGTVFLSRVWTNDKNYPDRVHYSATGSITDWQGASDSGALDIRPGDGDSEGITAIFAFKGRLFVAKRNRLYQVLGDSPENFQVLDVSSGLGVENQAAVAAVDQNDVLYMSNKGFHSVGTTSSYGDFQAQFLSAKIQPSFNDWELSRAKYTQAAYIPTLNSVVFSIAETATNAQDNLWLYNTQVKEWYRWPNVDAQALAPVLLSGKLVLFIGTSTGKIIRAQNGTKTDFGSTAIQYQVKTGTLYPDQNPIGTKGFKKLTLFFKPKSSYSFIARVKIDGFQEQIVGFSGTALGDRLGTNFVLGASVLGTDLPFVPHSIAIDGYGHGVTIDISQSGTGEDVDIYGFALEYEVSDFSQEGGTSNEGVTN